MKCPKNWQCTCPACSAQHLNSSKLSPIGHSPRWRAFLAEFLVIFENILKVSQLRSVMSYQLLIHCLFSLAIVIISMLSMCTGALIYFVFILQPSISAFRIFIITLGSTMILSVLICLTTGYIRSHSHRKLTFPVKTEPILTLEQRKTVQFNESVAENQSRLYQLQSPLAIKWQ